MSVRRMFSAAMMGIMLSGAAILTACSDTAKSQTDKPAPPASLSGNAVKEAELTAITLTEEAENRLSVKTEAARAVSESEVRRYSGEVVVPTGNSMVTTSAVAGAVEAVGAVPAVGMLVTKDQPLFQIAPLNPLVGADPIAAVSADAAQARVRVDAARQRKALADKSLADELVDARAREDAARQRKALADKTLTEEIASARAREEVARQRKARADRALASDVGTVRAQEEAQQEVTLAESNRQLIESRFQRSQAEAQQELTLATSAVRLAESRFQRSQQEAQQDLLVAQNALEASENRLRQIQSAPLHGGGRLSVRAPRDGLLRAVFVAPGQEVSAGTALFEVVDLGEVWVRVPVYAGESSTLIPSVTATVQKLSGAQSVQARPVLNAPPSGDPASSTIHLFYGLPNADARLKPGERVLVSIPVAGNHMWTAVPWSSIVFDTNGGTWLYESLGARRYSRRRVDVDHNAAGVAYLNAGVSAGTQVVTQGAAELWGFEFGTRK